MVGCVDQGQEWGLCPRDTEGVSVTELLDTPQTAVHSPRGHDQEGNKAVERSLKEINYCAYSNKCLFEDKGYMVTLFGASVLGGQLSVNNVQQRRTGQK